MRAPALPGLAAAAALAAVLWLGPGAARGEILLGLAGPITGPDAWLGDLTAQRFDLAVADLDAAGGLLGQRVEGVAVDDFCDPDQGRAAGKLVAEGSSP